MKSQYFALVVKKNEQSDLSERIQEINNLFLSMGLKKLVDSNRLHVYVNVSASSIKISDEGVVIGKIFRSIGGGHLSEFVDYEKEKLILSDGRSLISDFWGEYVAIFKGADKSKIHVVRDPAGMLSCYYFENENFTIIASDVNLLFITKLCSPVVNKKQIINHLLASELRTATTCLVDIKELLYGFRLTITADKSFLAELWSPWKFCEPAFCVIDEMEAVSALRESVIKCKGGSSFSCVNLSTPSAVSDERFYARLVSNAFNVNLVEEFLPNVDGVDIKYSDAMHLPRPLASSFTQPIHEKILRVANEIGADAIFDGGGGDNIFCKFNSAAVLMDQLIVEGFGKGMFRTAKSMSQLGEVSLWVVIQKFLKRISLRHRNYTWPVSVALLSPDAIRRSADAAVHPWLEAPKSALPGKAIQIGYILGFHTYLDGFSDVRAPRRVSPLMSQPIIEVCLRISSWLWMTGGCNRAIARNAFSSDLPSAVLERRLKGGGDDLFSRILVDNVDAIRTMLMEGWLSENNIIDRVATAKSLDAPFFLDLQKLKSILGFVDVEAWVQSWLKKERDQDFSF